MQKDWRNWVAENVKIKGSEKGKSCYILMGGLSAREINLDKLSKYDVITANHFFRTEDYKKVRPKYHVITDSNFFRDQQNIIDLDAIIEDFTTVFLNIRKAKPDTRSKFKYILPLYRVTNDKIKVDISRACSNFSTVTLTCIQLAMFLGYEKIYLVGFDLPPGHMPHYYAESEVEKNGAEIQRRKVEEFEYCSLYWQYTNCLHESYKIQYYANKNNIAIFNLSSISYIRAFPFLSFEES